MRTPLTRGNVSLKRGNFLLLHLSSAFPDAAILLGQLNSRMIFFELHNLELGSVPDELELLPNILDAHTTLKISDDRKIRSWFIRRIHKNL